jgi:hypothetical protein
MNSPCNSCDGYEKDECRFCPHKPRARPIEVLALFAVIATYYWGLFKLLVFVVRKIKGG